MHLKLKRQIINRGVLCILMLVFTVACVKKKENQTADNKIVVSNTAVIIDCNFTFSEAVKGTKAPKYIVDQLELITVHYYSMDGKIHQGQLLTNKLIVDDLRDIFREIFRMKFPVFQVVPIVKYNWDDEASMNDNNTYSFCYRNADYSKHAYGLAIDINPIQNPNRWKSAYSYRKNKPFGAVYDINAKGALNDSHPVVALFKEKGFLWGRNFTRNYDDHHFEKKNI